MQLATAEPGPVQCLPFLGQDGYLPERSATLFTGYAKVGKTTLLVQLLEEWLAAGRRVLYLTEEPRHRWERRLTGPIWTDALTMVHALGADPADLRAAAEEHEYDVLVIDTIRNVLGIVDETDNSGVARQLNPWVMLAQQRLVTFVAVHHETKSGGAHGRGIAGGHALFAALDGAVMLDRVKDAPTRRRLTVLHRDVEPPPLTYERDNTGRFAVVEHLPAPERDDPPEPTNEDLLLDATTHEWRTRADIAAAAGVDLSDRTVRRILGQLVAGGYIEQDPARGGAGVTFRYRKPGHPGHSPGDVQVSRLSRSAESNDEPRLSLVSDEDDDKKLPW